MRLETLGAVMQAITIRREGPGRGRLFCFGVQRMPFPSGTYVNQVQDYAVRQELEQFYSLLQGWLSVEHKESGAHSAVTADSLVVSGNITAAGTQHTLGSFVFRTQPSAEKWLVTVGGETDGWRWGRRKASSPLGNVYSWGLFDVANGDTVPVFEVGYYLTDDLYLLIPKNPLGRALGLGYKGGSSADRLKHVVVQDGVFEKARTVAAGYWQDYTPTWSTGGTLGNGTLSGRYTQIGNTAHYKIAFTIGSTTTFNGAGFLFTLPVSKRSDAFTSVDPGAWYAIDISAGATYGGFVQTNTTQAQPVTWSLVTANQMASALATATPFAWATGDILEIQGTYEIA